MDDDLETWSGCNNCKVRGGVLERDQNTTGGGKRGGGGGDGRHKTNLSSRSTTGNRATSLERQRGKSRCGSQTARRHVQDFERAARARRSLD